FEMPGGLWECVVGSMNFTQGGLCTNDEVAVLFGSDDSGAADTFGKLKATIDSYWDKAAASSQERLAAYREAWKRKQKAQKALRGKFGKPGEEKDDGGKPTLAIDKCQMTWAEFFSKVKSEREYPPHGNSMVGRLRVI